LRSTTFNITGSAPHAQASSSGTANVQTLTAPPSASACLVTVETTGCYAVFNGTTPSATNGIFIPTGVVVTLPVAQSISFASSAAAASKVNVVWLA
jgi:hypothetical protein